MISLKERIKRKVLEIRVQSFKEKNSVSFARSPYDFNLYKNYIIKVNDNSKINIINFDSTINYSKSNFIFRHDLDTMDCLRNAYKMIETHIENDVPLSVFLRMDDMDYFHGDSYKHVNDYAKQISIGLHSSCYINDDPKVALKEEIAKFQNTCGFSPKFITLHGLGSYKYNERLQLIKDLSVNYLDLGFSFADFIPELRTYDYVIQDCHLDNNQRVLLRDIENLPPLASSSCYLVLVHPCYWRFN